MQAVILAAGKSTRTHPLTLAKPKALLNVAGESIISHNINQVKDLVDAIIIVVGYLGGKIKEKIGPRFGDKKIIYAEQHERLGTFHALKSAERLLGERFVVMNGDDLYSKKDISNALYHRLCILASPVSEQKRFGIVHQSKGFLEKIDEKPDKAIGLGNTGLYVLGKSIFEFSPEKSERGELELTDALNLLAKKERISVEVVKDYWFPIGYPWDLLAANEVLLEDIKAKIEGTVEESATVKGNVRIGKGTTVKNGAYIEGPAIIGENCIIGPNCYIRPCSVIGDNSKIGNAVEIKNSIIGENVHIAHLSYFGDSVIGDNVNIGAGTISANLRHDKGKVKSEINGQLLDTGRTKFGCVIGDNAHTGISTSIYPGRKIWPGLTTLPGEIVRKDKKRELK